MSSIPVVLGISADGELLIQGILDLHGVSTTGIHHVSSATQFEVDSWTGEHEEHEHQHHPDQDYEIHANEPDRLIGDEDTPIASSDQFERQRSASLAAALLDLDPKGVPLVQFFQNQHQPILEVEEDSEGSNILKQSKETPEESTVIQDLPEAGDSEKVLSDLLFTLRQLKMTAPGKYTDAVQRLKELEEELRLAGAVTPADPAVSDAVARALTGAGPGRDIQIRVNQSRHTTTTKTVYETETPGMIGLDPEKIRELHQQMIDSLTSGATDSDAGTTQKKETAEEGFTNEDGSVVVSKKMTRVVTTTKTTMPGEAEPALGE